MGSEHSNSVDEPSPGPVSSREQLTQQQRQDEIQDHWLAQGTFKTMVMIFFMLEAGENLKP